MTTEMSRYTANGAVQRYQEPEDEEGSLGLSPDDVKPPFIRFNGMTGQLLFTHDGTVNESMDVAILRKLPDTRILFNPDLDAPDKVLCRSADALRPVDTAQAAKLGAGGEHHNSCQACPFAEFGKDDKGKTTRARCSSVLNVAVAVVPTTDDEMPIPALMALRSTAIKPMRAVLSQLDIMERTSRPPRRAYSWIVQLAAGDRQKDGTKTWVPLSASVVKGSRIADEDVPIYAALHRLMKHSTIDVATGAEMAADPDDSDTTVAALDRDAPMPQWMAVAAASAPATPDDEDGPDPNPLWEELKQAPPRAHGDPVDSVRRRGR